MSVQSNLESAVTGLEMMSESEFPFEYFSSEETNIDDNLALKLTDKPPGTLVTTTTLDDLLRNMIDPARGAVNPQQANQYQQMAETLKDTLQNLTVYRVGEVRVEVLIIGLTTEGTVAGVRTKLIET